MNVPSMVAVATLSLSALPLGCAASAPPPPKLAREGRVYRLDFTLAATEPGKPPTSSAYSMNVEERSHGELRVGSNTAVAPGGPRQDVGLVLRAGARASGDALLLETTTELSQSEEQGAVRKLAMRGDVLVAPGATAPVASLEDPTTHRRWALTVTATRLP
jgi:hypothetical protein